MPTAFTTVGHSTRSLSEFLDILRMAGIGTLVDVRSFPKSRRNPIFNTDRLPGDLADFQIGYRHVTALGGRRGKQAGVDPALNAMWRVQSFHNYADYALGEAFDAALQDLIALGQGRRIALMCSEAVWWRCHRRIIADYLLAHDHPVDHLMGAGRVQAAVMTPGAKPTGTGKVVYPDPGAPFA